MKLLRIIGQILVAAMWLIIVSGFVFCLWLVIVELARG